MIPDLDLFAGMEVDYSAKVSTLRKSRALAKRILEGLIPDHAPVSAEEDWWNGWHLRAANIKRELGDDHRLRPFVDQLADLEMTDKVGNDALEMALERAVLAWLQAEEKAHGP